MHDDFIDSALNRLAPTSKRSLRIIVDRETPATWQLALTPEKDVLTGNENDLVRALRSEDPVAGLARHTVIILKATRLCNLRCTYCHSWREGPGNTMEFPILARMIRDAVSDPQVSQVDFVWHGGEVTLLPIEYVKKALWLQQYFRHDSIRISNCIQTNATRLNSAWVQLFKAYDISVGVSIDGPESVHDQRRIKISGQGSWSDVKRGIDLLRTAGVSFGGLVVIDDRTLALGPRKLLDCLIELGMRAVALLNAVPPNQQSHAIEPAHLPFARYTEFLRSLFALWWTEYRGLIQIRELQSLVDAVNIGETPLCVFRENCMGTYLTVEPNGTVSACEKYVGDPAFVYGSLQSQRLGPMIRASQSLNQARTAVDEEKALMAMCRNYSVCRGGCPHDTRLRIQHGSRDRNCCGLGSLINDIRAASMGAIQVV